jgi:DNA-binding MarR family transcriptional regulator
MAEELPTTGSLVWHLAMRWRSAVDRSVAPLGLTHAQYSVLASLRAMTRDGAQPSQRQLAEYTGLGPIYVSKLVRALETAGYVSRAADPRDARAVKLALTEDGVDVADRSMAVVRDLDGNLTAALDADSRELRRLRTSLRTLLDTAPPSTPSQEEGD